MDNPKPNKCELRYNPEFNTLYYYCTELISDYCVYGKAVAPKCSPCCKYLEKENYSRRCLSKVAQVNAFYRFTQLISNMDNLDE